jgi:hypothetical protein
MLLLLLLLFASLGDHQGCISGKISGGQCLGGTSNEDLQYLGRVGRYPSIVAQTRRRGNVQRQHAMEFFPLGQGFRMHVQQQGYNATVICHAPVVSKGTVVVVVTTKMMIQQ